MPDRGINIAAKWLYETGQCGTKAREKDSMSHSDESLYPLYTRINIYRFSLLRYVISRIVTGAIYLSTSSLLLPFFSTMSSRL